MKMFGIYVHQNRVRYADLIVEGYKPVETRTRNMLKNLIGQRVAVIRTRDGKPADIVGYVTINRAEYHTRDELDSDAMRLWQTLIPPGSRYDCTGAGKWCYYLSRPEKLDTPVRLDDIPVIRKTRSYAVIDL